MSSDNSGNSGFSHVVNVASPIDTLNVGSVVAGSVSLAGHGQVVGYLPTDGITATSYWLNNVAGVVSQGAATSPLSTTLVLPQGAVITNVAINNNGITVVGGTTFGCGTAVVATTAPNGGTANIAAVVLLATVNSLAGGIFTNQALFGTAGSAGVLVSAANTGVFITNAAAITSGSIVVTINYTL